MRTAHFIVVAALPFVGCGPTAVVSKDSARASSTRARVTAGARVVFAADWTAAATGLLVSGQSVEIDYDVSRLASCRGAGWTLTGFLAVNGLPPAAFDVTAGNAFVAPAPAGDLALWFENADSSGCSAWDSAFGANYHFALAPPADAPAWAGDAASIIDRDTCPSGSFTPCSGAPRPLETGFTFDTWARQQAGFAKAFFDVWAPGVTDFENPLLWQQLDVEMFWRLGGQGPFVMRYVDFAEYTGNNARYAVNLRAIDALPGQNGGALTDPSQCPTFPVTVTPDRQYVQATLDYYFTVNGLGVQPPGGGAYYGVYQNYLGLYAVCGY
jgi:hypothetical protein